MEKSEGQGVCRDFMRNVCNRTNCKFIHPGNIRIRTEPIFCHDFQKNLCNRTTCKFIHCSREEEESFKQTGELPAGVGEDVQSVPFNNKMNGNGGGMKGSGKYPLAPPPLPPSWNDFTNNRSSSGSSYNANNNGGRRSSLEENLNSNGEYPISRNGQGGPPFRRRAQPDNGYYEEAPTPKRSNLGNQSQFQNQRRGGQGPPPPPPQELQHNKRYTTNGNGYSTNEYDEYDNYWNGNGPENGNPNAYNSQPPPPPPPHSQYQTSFPSPGESSGRNNGYNPGGPGQAQNYNQQGKPDAMKAMEEENFMLKRRIEELKTANEFLLAQNAQLRLNNQLSKDVPQAQASVVQTLVSMAQPLLTVTPAVASGPVVTTLPPTVSVPVSISHPLPIISQHQQINPGQTQTTVYTPIVTNVGV